MISAPVDRGPSEVARSPFQIALAWLMHPVTVAATGLLFLNDHVLKAA